MNQYIDSAIYSKQKPFLTFYQKVQNDQTMAIRLDYIFIDENSNHLISDTEVLFGNSDHLMVKCTLKLEHEAQKASCWRFDKNSFKNEHLKKEVLKEIKSVSSVLEWDLHKIYIQSIIRAYKKPKSPESRISQINKKITTLKNNIATDSSKIYLHTKCDSLELQIQEELSLLADRWQTRSKSQWIEQGEKSTKYFFSRYKIRHSNSALSEVKLSEEYLQNNEEVLSFIKNQYEKIY
jgi:hypothetical protein